MTGNDEGAVPRALDPLHPPLSLSLVIPAFNEGHRLQSGMARLLEAVATGAISPDTTEFIVVDDGSTDDTAVRATTLLSAFPHVKIVRLAENRGKGAAVRAGVASATSPVIAFADADMAIDPAQTPEFVTALRRADLAIGSRAAIGATVDRPSIRRSVMNRLFNQLVNLLTRVSLEDTQCGYKAFRAPAAKLLFHCSVTERFAFDVEVLSLARKFGLTIAEVPVRWLRVGGSRVRPWADVGSMARDVIRASRGTTSAPPIHVLVVKLPSGGDSIGPRTSAGEMLQKSLAPSLPVIRQPGGTVLVLCPLMNDTEIDDVASQIAEGVPDVSVERVVMTTAQLCDLAPLSLTWDDDPVSSTKV